MSASELVRADLGAAQAAEGLYDRHGRRVHAFCLSRLRNAADAEDATQTTFMHAVRALDRGVTPRFESTWLLRIAENVCHSMRRRAYRRYESSGVEAEARDAGGEDRAHTREQVAALCEALETLPENQRRAVVLREWRGLSYDEIADELATSHAAVETLLFRARRSLAARIATAPSLLPSLPIGRPVAWLLGSGGAKAAATAAVVTTAAVGVVHATSPVAAAPTAAAPPGAPSEMRARTSTQPARGRVQGRLRPHAGPVTTRPPKVASGQSPSGTNPGSAPSPEAVPTAAAPTAAPAEPATASSSPPAAAASADVVDDVVAVVEAAAPVVKPVLPSVEDVAAPLVPVVETRVAPMTAPAGPSVEVPPLPPVEVQRLNPVPGPPLDP